jgi:hypothetical protein
VPTGLQCAQGPGILLIMSSTIRQTVTVRPGGLVEIRSPELREGDQAEVTVVVIRPPNGEPQAAPPGGWRRYAGAVNRNDAHAGDNQRIDADLANEYGGGADAER